MLSHNFQVSKFDEHQQWNTKHFNKQSDAKLLELKLNINRNISRISK